MGESSYFEEKNEKMGLFLRKAQEFRPSLCCVRPWPVTVLRRSLAFTFVLGPLDSSVRPCGGHGDGP